MTTYLITGANRGIGRGIANVLLSRPDTTLVAFVRNPDHETSQSLLSSAPEGKVILVRYDASDPASVSSSMTELQSRSNIKSLDVVIANAGFVDWEGPSAEVPPEALISHLTVNTIAPITLFAATLPLLRASTKPKFFPISSGVGSITLVPQRAHLHNIPYGMSKAALNYAFAKIALENPDVHVEMLAPGHVQTEMMDELLRKKGVDPSTFSVKSAVPLEKSVAGIVRNMDMANEETRGGFKNWNGDVIPW